MMPGRADSLGSHSKNEQSKASAVSPTATVPQLKIFAGVEPVIVQSSQLGGAFFCDLGHIHAVTILVSLHLPRDSLSSQCGRW